MINTKELTEQLPGSWDEMYLKDYMRLLDIQIKEHDPETDNLFVGVDNIIEVLSELTDISVDELESVPFHQIQPMVEKLSFILTPPEPLNQSTINWKKLEEITYDNFVTFLKLSADPLHNLPQIIKGLAKDKWTDEQIANMSVTEAHTGFFFLRKYLRKYLKHTVFSLRATRLRQRMTTLFREKSNHNEQPFKNK